jgi:hypothetical protein
MGGVCDLGLGALGRILLGPHTADRVKRALEAADGIPLSADGVGSPLHLVVEIRGDPHGVCSVRDGIVPAPCGVPLLLVWVG